MNAYGIKRNYNDTDDFLKNEVARRRTTQSKVNKLGRRLGRHRNKNKLRKMLSLGLFDS